MTYSDLIQPGESYIDCKLAAKLDAAPQASLAEWRKLADDGQFVGAHAEEIEIAPLIHPDGVEQRRSRPGRSFLTNEVGEILAVLNREG